MIRVKKDNKRIQEENKKKEEEEKKGDGPVVTEKVRKSPGEIRLQKEVQKLFKQQNFLCLIFIQIEFGQVLFDEKLMKIFISILVFFFCNNLLSAETSHKVMPKHDWSFNGVTGTFDRAALQRGYKVYREYMKYGVTKSLFYLFILSINSVKKIIFN